MGSRIKINPMKQNTRMKQYIGWFIAVLFPFAAKGLMDETRIPLIAALIYWLICGILLRYILEKKLPYLNPQFKTVKKEVFLLLLTTAISGYLYIKGVQPVSQIPRELLLNTIFFAILNGVFEQLVWINVYDLAGSKIRLTGFVAVFCYIALIYALFWGRFISMPLNNSALFIAAQTVMFLIPLSIYNKTKDLTIWSVQHILYNLIIVYFGGFGISMFIHLQ